MEEIISSFLHVKLNQFCKDTLDTKRDTKSLEIRKANHGRRSTKNDVPSTLVVPKCTAAIQLSDIKENSPHKINSYTAIQNLVFSGASESMLIKMSVSDLQKLCAAYNIHTPITCPMCKEVFMNETYWVGCDEECESFICRKCASLENGDYNKAVSSYWSCPCVCSSTPHGSRYQLVARGVFQFFDSEFNCCWGILAK